jgi:hypothetical protein
MRANWMTQMAEPNLVIVSNEAMVWMKTLTELFDIIEDPYRLFAQMEFTAL